MKSENQHKEPKDGLGVWFFAIVITAVSVTVVLSTKFLWIGSKWLMKQLYMKSPIVLRGTWRATTWTGKTLMKKMPERKVLPTPDIFRNEKVAPARAFNLQQLNRLK